MGRKKLHENRRKGFTVAEMLIVVGVIAVLLGIAIPTVVSLSRSMQMSELDASARQIFIAAQNRLTALRAADEVGALNLKNPVEGTPSDAGEGFDPSNLYWVSQDDLAADILLPFGSIEPEVRAGQYVIELDPTSASVYSVFYSEETFEYAEFFAKRDTAARKNEKPVVGYYGGAAAIVPELSKIPPIEVEIKNEEELYVLLKNYDPQYEYVVMVNEVGALETAKAEKFNDILHKQSTADGWKIILDNLDEWRFSDLYGDIITPGANIEITITAALSAEPIAVPSVWSGETNSLFALRTNEEVNIKYGRHLQNLDTVTSKADTGITKAVQDNAIDWTAAYEKKEFQAIRNENLRLYQGNNQQLRNLHITGGGLFDMFQKGTIEKVILIDTTVNGETYAGALAGHIENTEVSNCAVYLSHDVIEKVKDTPELLNGFAVSATDIAGGLIGSAKESKIEKSFAALPVVHGETAGGLIGQTDGCTIQMCYADTTEVSGNYTGGLIGAAKSGTKGTTVTDCYAVGYMAGTEVQAGFAAQAQALTATNCYAAATFSKFKNETETAAVYAFANRGVYTNCRYLTGAVNSAPAPQTADPAGMTATPYEELAKADMGENWTCATGETTIPYRMDKIIENAKKDSILAKDSALSAEIYPFPRLTELNHYNDWPILDVLSTIGVVYYEKRLSDNYVGLSGYTMEKKQYMDKNHTLQTQGTVFEDGYALVGVQEKEGYVIVRLTANKVERTLLLMKDEDLSKAIGVPVYPMNINDMSNIMRDQDSSFLTLTYENVSFYFNPCAADSVTIEKPTNKHATVRTARQLKQISLNDLLWNYEITQELDIHYEQYNAGLSVGNIQQPIGNAAKPFSGTYFGGNHLITGLNIQANAGRPAGLFGYLTGSVSDITFVSDLGKNSGSRTVSGSGAVGGLVGENHGTISDCASAGFAVQSGVNCGGLVGLNYGTITHSYADQSLVSGTSVGGLVSGNFGGTITSCYALGLLSGTQDVGGFAGLNSGTISNCYSASHSTNTSPSSWLFGPENTGTYTNCYGLKKNGNQDMIAGDHHENNFKGIAESTWASLQEGNHLSGFTANKDGLKNSHPYSAALKGQKYPFPSLFDSHYGDWPLKNESGSADMPEAPEEPEVPQAAEGILGVAVQLMESEPKGTRRIKGYSATLKDRQYVVDYDTPQVEFVHNKKTSSSYMVYFNSIKLEEISTWGYCSRGTGSVKPLSEQTKAFTYGDFTFVNIMGNINEKIYFCQRDVNNQFPRVEGNIPETYEFYIDTSNLPKGISW